MGVRFVPKYFDQDQINKIAKEGNVAIVESDDPRTYCHVYFTSIGLAQKLSIKLGITFSKMGKMQGKNGIFVFYVRGDQYEVADMLKPYL